MAGHLENGSVAVGLGVRTPIVLPTMATSTQPLVSLTTLLPQPAAVQSIANLTVSQSTSRRVCETSSRYVRVSLIDRDERSKSSISWGYVATSWSSDR